MCLEIGTVYDRRVGKRREMELARMTNTYVWYIFKMQFYVIVRIKGWKQGSIIRKNERKVERRRSKVGRVGGRQGRKEGRKERRKIETRNILRTVSRILSLIFNVHFTLYKSFSSPVKEDL